MVARSPVVGSVGWVDRQQVALVAGLMCQDAAGLLRESAAFRVRPVPTLSVVNAFETEQAIPYEIAVEIVME